MQTFNRAALPDHVTTDSCWYIKEPQLHFSIDASFMCNSHKQNWVLMIANVILLILYSYLALINYSFPLANEINEGIDPSILSIVNLRLFPCERLVQDDMWCGQSHFRILSLIELQVSWVTIIIQLSLIYQKNVAKTTMFDLLDLIRKLLSQIIIGVRIIRGFELMEELHYV